MSGIGDWLAAAAVERSASGVSATPTRTSIIPVSLTQPSAPKDLRFWDRPGGGMSYETHPSGVKTDFK